MANAVDFFLDQRLAFWGHHPVRQGGFITWDSPGSAAMTIEFGPATAGQYLDWLDEGQYSLLMRDGSLLQLSYGFDGGELVRHRLAFIPCPVAIDLEGEEASYGVAEAVWFALEETEPRDLLQRSPIRFDYDSAAASTTHPAVHLTLNHHECRIACIAPVHPHQFIDFIFTNFYPDDRRRAAGWFDIAQQSGLDEFRDPLMRPEGIHISWDRHASANW